MVTTAVGYKGNKYDEYTYPDWANSLGWLLTMSSVVMVPVVIVWKLGVSLTNQNSV